MQNMYNRSISFKVLFWKPPYMYINDAIIDKKILNQLNIMVTYVDINGICHSVAIFEKFIA